MAAHKLRSREPCFAAQFRIVMLAVNALCHHVPQNAADKHIGGEMLASTNPGVVDEARQCVNGDLRERPRIFMGNHTGGGECGGSVFGRKGGAAIKEWAAPISLVGPLAAQRI